MDLDVATGSIVNEINIKDLKKLKGLKSDINYVIREKRRQERSISSLNDVTMISFDDDDIDMLASNDRRYRHVSKTDMPEFKGDLLNEKDYYKYMLKLDEYEENQMAEEDFHGRHKTNAEIEELRLKEELEENGWDIRKLYKDKSSRKKMKKMKKKDMKRESRMKQKIINLQSRKNVRRMSDADVDCIGNG